MEIIQFFINKGIKLNHKNNDNMSAFQLYYCSNNKNNKKLNMDILKLLDKSCNCDLMETTEKILTPYLDNILDKITNLSHRIEKIEEKLNEKKLNI